MKFYKLFPPVFQERSDMQRNIKKGKTQKPTCTECRRSVFASGVFYVDVLGYLLLKGSTELIALLCDGAAVAQAVDGADDVLLGRFGMEGTHPQYFVAI